MRRFLLVIVAAIVALTSGSALAQKDVGGGFEWGAEQKHKLEITPYGGYVWWASRDGTIVDGQGNLRTGNFDIKSGEFYGVEADINVKPGFQLALLWQRQDTDLEFKSAGITESVPFVVEYWQIGGVTGVQRDNIMPFTMFTLGGVRTQADGFDDQWDFGVILGLGAKIYLSERIGIRLQGRLPWIITNFGAGIFFGTGGASAGISGSGILGGDLGAGLIIAL